MIQLLRVKILFYAFWLIGIISRIEKIIIRIRSENNAKLAKPVFTVSGTLVYQLYFAVFHHFYCKYCNLIFMTN